MQGVTDAPMRALQGATEAFTFAVSEFLRVGSTVPPEHVFTRHVPELRTGGRTPTGLPVQVQLLGGDAGRLAEAAAVAHATGATAIDLNFGCPARTVNRHDGGATLLRYPQRIRAIVCAVRSALPADVPVSAKLRLGWDGVEAIDTNADMAAEGGAAWLTIHARTRTQGYAPPVYWARIGRVRERLGIPVVANGDIWTIQGFRRCREETGCRHFMLGRGALANPGLAHRIAVQLGIVRGEPDAEAGSVIDWPSHLEQLVAWTADITGHAPERTLHRLKQWLKMAATYGSFMRFEAVKRARSVAELLAILRRAACATALPQLTLNDHVQLDRTRLAGCARRGGLMSRSGWKAAEAGGAISGA
jgi:tRNA-dihydrouridine synthase C